MDFKRTATAIIAAALIGGAALAMSAFSDAADKGITAREQAITAAAAAQAAQEVTTAAPEITPEPTPQPEPPVIADSTVYRDDAIVYRGIEPNHTEETLPERAGFTYYDGVDLDKVTQDFIFVEAGEAAVNYELVLAIIIEESNCDPNAISKTDDWGLMQINKCNHAWLAEQYGLTDMLDVHQNIIAGITILSQLYKYDDGTDAGLHKVLMAYNLGPGGAAKAWENGTYSTTYSREVMQIRDDLLCGKYTKGA